MEPKASHTHIFSSNLETRCLQGEEAVQADTADHRDPTMPPVTAPLQAAAMPQEATIPQLTTVSQVPAMLHLPTIVLRNLKTCLRKKHPMLATWLCLLK